MGQEKPKRRKKTLEAILTVGLWWGGITLMTNMWVCVALPKYEISERLTYKQLMEVMKRRGYDSLSRATETIIHYPGYYFATLRLPALPENQFEKWYSERYKETQPGKPKNPVKENDMPYNQDKFLGDWSKIPWK